MNMTAEPKWVQRAANAAVAAALEIINGKKPFLPEEKPDSPLVLITPEQLLQCSRTSPKMSNNRAKAISDLINQLCPKYGIKTKGVLHEFLATVMQESHEFQYRVENMNYRAETIVKVWPGRFYLGTPVKGKLDAKKYAHNPKALAIAAYGSRMGNRPGTEDGWNLRGGGFIGLTGYYVYEAYRRYKKFETVEEAATYCRNSDTGGLDSALWFFCVLKDLLSKAEMDDMIGITKEVNGGLIGLDDRLKYYELVKKYVA